MKLGIIAGGGALPAQLAAHCRKDGTDHQVFAIAGQGYNDARSPGLTFRLGGIGNLFRLLRQEGITDIVFIGSVRKPSLLALRPDWFLIKLLFRLGFLRGGDDSLLRRVASEFKRHLGVNVRGIHEFMPELLAPVGQIGAVAVDAVWEAPLRSGISAARQHGQADRGQAIIMGLAAVLAVEEKAGTAAMLKTYAMHADQQPAILIKLSKPQQDLRLDMPTIGPATVQQAVAAGLSGIVVEAEKTLMVDKERTIADANEAGLFLTGIATK